MLAKTKTESLYADQYEQKHQIASGAFSSVFCIRAKAKKSKVHFYNHICFKLIQLSI